MLKTIITSALSLATIFAALFSVHATWFGEIKVLVCGAMAGAGILVWILGRYSGTKEEYNNPSPGLLAFTMRYWGPILVGFGIVLFIMSPRDVQQLRAASAPAKLFPNKAQPTNHTERPFQLEGVFAGGKPPAAIINGVLWRLGERVGDAQLVSVGRDSVTLQVREQRHVLKLGRPTSTNAGPAAAPQGVTSR